VGKKARTGEEDIIWIYHQTTTGDGKADGQDFICALPTDMFEVCDLVTLS
jgi:hypothetical protein